MEIIAFSGVHSVPPKSSPTESNFKVDESSISLTSSNAVATCSGAINKKNDIENETLPVVSEDHNAIPSNLNTAQNVATSSSFPKDSNISKPIRPKTSDKLTKVIETCKKLHKLSEQNNINTKQQGVEHVSNVSSGVAESIESLSDVTSIKEASEPVSEASVNLPKSSEDDYCLMSDNAENDSWSSLNSTNISQSTNEDSSTPLSHFTPGSTSDLVLKRFLFLFRPSDHEVLVRDENMNLYRCNICLGVYRQKFSLKRHFLRTHINFRYISKSDISNCKIAVPDEHLSQDSNIDCSKRPAGSKCRKKFKSSNAIFLENNKGRVMPGLYVCHICGGAQFDLEHELRDHFNKHSDAERKKFQCDKCSASFYKKQILSRHLASHGERAVRKSCKRCGAEFSSVMEYQKHLISHSSGRVCKYCSKILSTSANRKRHEALHLGLKPYRCVHCGLSFAQSKDLDRHLKKQHSELCYFCDSCNKLFPSQASLDVHIHEKHSDSSPKKPEKSPSPDPVVPNKPTVTQPESVPVAVPVKLKVCFVCKRSFQSFYAMMKHRTQAHPYHTRRRKNRKTMKQKMEQAKQAGTKDQGAKVRKPYGRPPKQNSAFQTSTVRRGRPPLDRSVKFGRQYERSGPRFLTKRDKELAKKEEMEFYFSVSEKIAENLLHFVDGKTSQLSLKEYNFSDQQFPSCNFEEFGRFPWSNYNFPVGYDVDHALNTRGHEVKNKSPENLSSRDKCLYATGLNRVHKLPQATKSVCHDKKDEIVGDVTETALICEPPLVDIKKLNLLEKRKLIGRKVPIVCVCYVCKEKFESNTSFEEHCVNNHPNVDCSCIEIEGNKDTPPTIPGDLCKQEVTPDGLFFSWNVPPPLSDASLLKCTKCKSNFKTSFELHSHIIKCGNLRSSPCHVWKPYAQKRIKRTMKSRMSFARQQAAVHAYAKKFKTPEKQTFDRNDAIVKSCEKMSKSAEKSQFYKSGRLQTTSFTVDMNYFKTKPVKPPTNTQSKRGRKSYATLSYRYRNASVQSSCSECPHCREAFPSQSALNIHLQHHCIFSVLKRNEKAHSMNDPSPENMSIDSSGGKISPADSAFSGWNKFKNVHGDGKIKCSSDMSLFSQSANSNKLLFTSENLSNHAKEAKNDLSVSVNDENIAAVNMKISDEIETPIDLSKYSDVETGITVDLSNKEKDTSNSDKSALEIAMEAVQVYYQNSEQNEHISKLQKTVEKLTAVSEVTSPQIQKSVSVKKVGRPKKVKRQAPFHLRKNLTAVMNNEVTNSKPVSKLEETVKRLTESKVKSIFDLKYQKTSPFKTIDATKGATHSEKKSDVPAAINLVQPIFRTPDKIVNHDINKSPSPGTKSTSNITLSIASNFVPLIIYGDHSKSNNALLLTGISQNKDKSPLSRNVCKNATANSVSPVKTATTPKNTLGSDKNRTPEKTLKAVSRIEDVPSSTATGSPDKKPEKTRLSSGSQGRISPSLESIVNSIKQKLHSQEQESPPQDDACISWLEDEKFEIPSRPKLIISANSSSSSPLSVENEPFCPISTDTSLDQEKSDSNELLKTSCENIPKVVASGNILKIVASETAVDKTHEKNAFASSVSQKIESLLVGSVTSHTLQTKTKNDKTEDCQKLQVSTTADLDCSLNSEDMSANDVETGIQHAVSNAPSDLKISQISVTENHATLKVATLTSSDKEMCIRKEYNPPTQSPVRKKPGRPKKKVVELNIDTSASEIAKITESPEVNIHETALEKEVSVPNLKYSSLSVENAPLTLNNELNQNIIEESDIPVGEKISDADLSESNLSHGQHELLTTVNPESDDSQGRPSCATTPDNVNAPHEENSSLPKMSTLRAFRTKSKQTMPAESEIMTAVEPKLTTEFGKSLASRMKEKMRLSFEIAASESTVKPDEGSTSDGVPDSSDINSTISDDDSEYLREIKREIETFEPSKKHSCPFCMLEFAYLTNFRRHLRLCRARLETKEVEPVPCTSTTVLQYLPKKDEVEHSMLNLLRHQSRQTQMLKEAEKSNGSKVESKFRTYNCNVCHRIYLSLFKLLQHQVTHKLESKDSTETNVDLDDTKDINDIEKYSVNELDDRNIQDSEINEDIDSSNAKLIKDEKPVEVLSSFIDETGFMSDLTIQEGDKNFEDDKIRIKHVSEVIEDVVRGSDVDIGSECIHTVSTEILYSNEATVKVEEQPVKRKRGRPFGWRKHSNVTEDNLTKTILRNNLKTCKKNKSVVFGIKRKAGKLHPGPIKLRQKTLSLTKLDIKTSKTIANKLKKEVISHKQFDFLPSEELHKNVPVDKIEIKQEISTLPTFQDTSKNIPSKTLKRFFTKGSTISNVAFKNNDGSFHKVINKNSQKITTLLKVKSPVVPNSDLNQSVKGPKDGSIVAGKPESICIKSEFPLKRRPGRPPKALQSPIPSTSSQSQHSGSARRFGKMMAKTVIVDSSDSEYDVPENQGAIQRKKALKVCPICKLKFSASLVFYRHIQLVHSRCPEPTVLKTDVTSGSKAVKKILPKAPASAANPDENKDVKKSSPKTVDKIGDYTKKASKKIITNSTNVFSVDTVSTKSFKKGNAKSPSADTADKTKRLTKKATSGATVCDDNDDDFQAHAKVFKKMSRTARITSDPTSPKIVKKLNAKSAAISNSDVESPKNFKAISSLFNANSDANSQRTAKGLSAKSAAKASSDAVKTKSLKKRFSRSFSANSVARSPKVVKKYVTKSAKSVSPKVVKKFSKKVITDGNCETGSTKTFKKAASKSTSMNIDAISPKVLKKLTKSAADSNSDTDSSKSFRKGIWKPLTIKPDPDGPIVAKRPALKFGLDDSSDADSIKSFKKRVTKLSSIESDSSSPKSVKKLTLKSATDDNSEENSTKSSKMVYMQRVTVYNSDSESVKSFRKYIKKPATIYNSDPESVKNSRRAIPKPISIENSDADSEFSIKTDITSRILKKCPICKEKFTANIVLHRHIELVHSRKSTPASIKSNSAKTVVPSSPKVQSPSKKMKKIQSPSMKIRKMIDAASRSALSRQCRKPLPPLKRKWSKRESPSQVQNKRPKLI